MEKFDSKQWGLPRVLSNHSPILLMKDERDWDPHPFRFLNSWIEQPSFLDVVSKSWAEIEIEGWAGYCIFKKLQALKLKLKAWSRSNVGNIIEKLKLVKEKGRE